MRRSGVIACTPWTMLTDTNGKAVSTVVHTGAWLPSPNQITVMNAQMIAGRARKTIRVSLSRACA